MYFPGVNLKKKIYITKYYKIKKYIHSFTPQIVPPPSPGGAVAPSAPPLPSGKSKCDWLSNPIWTMTKQRQSNREDVMCGESIKHKSQTT